MTKKLAKTLDVAETSVKYVEKKIENQKKKKGKSTKATKKVEEEKPKEEPKSEEENIKDQNKNELSELFDKETELYRNLKEDNKVLREKSLSIINHIEVLIESMIEDLITDHSSETIKAFAQILKNFNEISNSLSNRNAEIYKYEIDIFKEKLTLLEDFFTDKLNNKSSTDDMDNETKRSFKDIVEAIKKAKR